MLEIGLRPYLKDRAIGEVVNRPHPTFWLHQRTMHSFKLQLAFDPGFVPPARCNQMLLIVLQNSPVPRKQASRCLHLKFRKRCNSIL